MVAVGCGKSGPPLPPLIKLPAAPANVVAERRGATVNVQFTVPSANTDGTRPANVERVDVYAITGPPSLTDEQIIKLGTKVGGVTVKAPRDPDHAVDPDDPDSDVEPPEGKGLNQGTLAHVTEEITSDAFISVDPESEASRRQKARIEEEFPQPLVGPSFDVPSRTYVGVGISTRGRKGPLSKRVAVPLVPPPPPPAEPTIKYTENAVTVTWPAVAIDERRPEVADDVLPSRPIGRAVPTIAYHVYDVAPDAASDAAPGSSIKLTKTPVAEPAFEDERITWGERRCYTVRTVETIGGLRIESDAAPPACKTLTDTFPPAAPKNLQAVATEGAISLIWDASPEKDLAGYLVLRGPAEGENLEPLTPEPIQDPRFNDTVQSGTQYAYVVKAVDKLGNVSRASNRVIESARE